MCKVKDQLLRLPDGRALGYRVWGHGAGLALLFLHGTPGSRLKFAIGHELGRKLGLAIVAPDRWGYGLSDVPPRPSLRAFAGDMAVLMDHLGHGRFAVGGISGGAPFAAGVAAHLAPRVSAVALVSPVGPIADAGGAAAMPPLQRFVFLALPRLPALTAALFSFFRLSLQYWPRLAARLATLNGGAADKALIALPKTRDRLLLSFREGLRAGSSGPITDLLLFSRPWELDLAAISAPARVWLGSADNAVPRAAARALASAIARCGYEEMGGQGHLWVAANYPSVLAWIAAVAAPPPPTPC